MKTPDELTFAVKDLINNEEVSPFRVPLSLLGEFQKDVSDFLRGSSKSVNPADVLVSVEEGSLALVATGLMAASSLWADIDTLRTGKSLDVIDSKRAAVVERWQESARRNKDRKYSLAEAESGFSLVVDALSNFHRAENLWVTVEKYVEGMMTDWGGKTQPNVHIQTEAGENLKIAASQELLAKEKMNRLYRLVTLHISIETNLSDGKTRNPSLISFVDSPAGFDEAEFEEMVRRGTKAWSDVDQPSKWVDELRGGSV